MHADLNFLNQSTDYIDDVLHVKNSISQLEESKDNVMENKKWMKPFELGWKREVVMRVVTDNKKPNCDIYYFHPNGQKFRSMAEVKANLMDGLDPECFTFKKQPLNVSSEMIRQARVRGAKPQKQSADKEIKNQKPKTRSREVVSSKTKTPDVTDVEKPRPIIRSKSRRQSMIQKKQQLKAVMNLKKAKQARVVPAKKKPKKANGKKVASNDEKKNELKTTKNNISNKNKKIKPLKKEKSTKLSIKKKEVEKETRSSRSPDRTKEKTRIDLELSKDVEDIKSIVQKNIVKYREMRRKEMLEKFERKDRSEKKSTAGAGRPPLRHRPGNISENFDVFIQPLEKGWKRELVYRNGGYPNGQSDVYYYNPTGKKFRSAREVLDHLTPGLSIDNFTFRKEALGCGEPKEIIRNARPHQKNLVANNSLGVKNEKL